MPSADIEDKRRAAREVIDVLEEISLLLVCTRLSTPPFPTPFRPSS